MTQHLNSTIITLSFSNFKVKHWYSCCSIKLLCKRDFEVFFCYLDQNYHYQYLDFAIMTLNLFTTKIFGNENICMCIWQARIPKTWTNTTVCWGGFFSSVQKFVIIRWFYFCSDIKYSNAHNINMCTKASISQNVNAFYVILEIDVIRVTKQKDCSLLNKRLFKLMRVSDNTLS